MELRLPKHVSKKTLRNGRTAYFFTIPPWARRREDCPVGSEALGIDFLTAAARAAILNKSLEDYRAGNEPASGPRPGTVDWLAEWFADHPKVTRLADKTQRFYKQGMDLLRDHVFQVDGQRERIGDQPAASLLADHADAIYEGLKTSPDGRRRITSASMAMKAARRCWHLAKRRGYVQINPFEEMGLEKTGESYRAVTREELEAFIETADRLGLPSVGTAARITFDFMQRETDVIERLAWSHYAGDTLKVVHNKKKKWVDQPLYDLDESGRSYCLFPELVERLETAKSLGSLIVMRDRPDRRTGQHLPYNEHLFRKHVRKVRRAAGLPEDVTFIGARHGGMTELGDSGVTDQEMTALSTRTRQTLTVYTRETKKQVVNAQKKRLDLVSKSKA